MPVDVSEINAIYRKYLGRDAEPQAVESWGKHDSIINVERGVWGSDEFRSNPICLHVPNLNKTWKVCILEEAKMIFVPIAKNAHTSLLDAFLKFKGVDWRKLPIHDELALKYGDDDIKVHYALQSNTGLVFKDHSLGYIDEILGRDDWIRVVVYRDPLSRFVSAFNHLFLREMKNPFWLRHIKNIFPNFENEDISVNGHQGELLGSLIKYIFRQEEDVEVHFMRQSQYVSDFEIDCLIPIERLDVLRGLVYSRSGRDIEIPRLNVRGGVMKFSPPGSEQCWKIITGWTKCFMKRRNPGLIASPANSMSEKPGMFLQDGLV